MREREQPPAARVAKLACAQVHHDELPIGKQCRGQRILHGIAQRIAGEGDVLERRALAVAGPLPKEVYSAPLRYATGAQVEVAKPVASREKVRGGARADVAVVRQAQTGERLHVHGALWHTQ